MTCAFRRPTSAVRQVLASGGGPRLGTRSFPRVQCVRPCGFAPAMAGRQSVTRLRSTGAMSRSRTRRLAEPVAVRLEPPPWCSLRAKAVPVAGPLGRRCLRRWSGRSARGHPWLGRSHWPRAEKRGAGIPAALLGLLPSQVCSRARMGRVFVGPFASGPSTRSGPPAVGALVAPVVFTGGPSAACVGCWKAEGVRPSRGR
jgi:hypothetical protein